MTAHTFRGPQEYAFPHQQALDGAAGTLVLTPGKSYDFGTDATGQEVRPIGPAWWWDPQPSPEEAPEPEPVPVVKVPDMVTDAYSDDYDSEPALAGAGG